MNLFNQENIHYDSNSKHEFGQLNESKFITSLFGYLMEIMGERFKEFEFFVFSINQNKELPISMHRDSDKKKILLYFSDESGADPSSYSHHYFAVFKSYIGNNVISKNVFPLALGCVGDVPEFPIIPIHERKYNVFFRGNLNPNRIGFYRNFSSFRYFLPNFIFNIGKVISLLFKIKNDFSAYFPNSIIIFNDKFKSGYSPVEYSEVLAQSKIILSPKGFDSTECFRLYESMRAGCVIVSEKLPEIEFYANSPIIQVENWKEGLKKVKKLISDTDQLEKIHQQTIDWWKNKCSERAIAQYIHGKIQSLENPIAKSEIAGLKDQ